MAKKCQNKSVMHVQSCCFAYKTYCFVEVLVAVLSLDIGSHHVDAHARWKSKRLLAVVSFPSKRSVRPAETTARRVIVTRGIIEF